MTPPPRQSSLAAALDRAAARAVRDDASSDDVLHALGLAVLARRSGALLEVAAARRAGLVRAGRRAVLALGGPGDGDAAEDARLSTALGRAGIAALEGSAAARTGADPMCAPDGRLAAAASGRLDGLGSAAIALHAERCARCASRLDVLWGAERGADEHAEVRLAAATVTAMRSPREGRTVASLRSPAAEAVLFDDAGGRSLAVYCDAGTSVRLVADGLETIDSQRGYVLVRIVDDRDRLDAMLHVDDRAVRWKLALQL